MRRNRLRNKISTTLDLGWRWLLGVPDQEKVTQAKIKASIVAMQKNIVQLTEALGKVSEANKQATQRYEAKQQEAAQLLKKAQLAYQSGDQDEAKITMTQVVLIEKMLPHLANVVEKSRQVLADVTQKLRQEQEKLEIYKLEMDNLQFFQEINTIMKNIVESTTESPFDDLRDKVENLKTNIQVLDLENHSEKLLDQLELHEQIEKRLQEKS